MNSTKVVNVIIAIFLPPVAVFLARGWGVECIVDLLLTIFFFFPGMLYALYIVLTS
ncbi:ACR079Wp [Eremothecium gossypii ATCC 10895]|uniref:Plasma membrane proteolipid 3 n=1 Tax=Eremothecium gossypii (strain ATCC 10895 / CBS 109.51 / FGSC 9923 / NRRL Y-1056) TaxID=284811 RepID=PMP3_EREGS|nr:ACR079Wp [Eremothecium gossypii ATCC 10895]Q75C38.1 RecName: Full=Plasma membrane proteolipid 3 [Eremothecium gossypii ATCC 10895]AAS51305.1 ACR079Wp [Eremothecium gossypii ATCC 10895]AEY95597.1 FACR079Wp [Eremothecium gossypii FDAG1]